MFQFIPFPVILPVCIGCICSPVCIVIEKHDCFLKRVAETLPSMHQLLSRNKETHTSDQELFVNSRAKFGGRSLNSVNAHFQEKSAAK